MADDSPRRNTPRGIPAREMLPSSRLPGGRSGCFGSIGAIIGALVLFLIVSLFFSSATVQAGYVGLVLTFGRVEDRVLQPGFHFVIPISQKIVQMDVRVLPHDFKDIDAASKELQSVKLTGTMNYHLDPAREERRGDGSEPHE